MARMIDAVQVLHNINLHHRPTPVSEFESGFNDGLNQAMWEITHAPTLTQPNDWISVEDRMPEPGSLIVYADVCIDEVAYGVLRVPQGKCHKVYNYWMCLSDRFNRRPPEGEEEEKHVIEITENL